MRTAECSRKTRETEITVGVNLDGIGESEIDTGCKFLDHMLTSLSTHSLINIKVTTRGDFRHHIIEDTAIVVGEALKQAIQQDNRITRFSDASVPMDCSQAMCSVDLGGRPYHVIDLTLVNPMIEDIACEDLTHFMETLAYSLGANIHLKVQYGENDHHKAEAAFKALARCLRVAVSIDSRRIGAPSSKGAVR